MKISRPIALTLSILSVSTMFNAIPIQAQSTDYGDGSEEVAEINEIMNQMKSGAGDMQATLDSFSSSLSDLSKSYAKLSKNYGTAGKSNASDVYADYLQNMQTANEDTGYTEKLEAIQNSDISINDATMATTYAKLKKNIKSTMKSAGLDISSSTSKSAKKTAKKNTANLDTLTSVSDATEKYQDMLSEYKSGISSGDTDVENPYVGKTLSSRTSSLTDSVSTSYYNSGSFTSTADLFKANNSGKSNSNSNSSSSDTSSNGSYSSISEGIGK